MHFPSHGLFLLKQMIWFLFVLFLSDFLGLRGGGGISVHAEQLLKWIPIRVTSSGWFKLLATHPSHYAKVLCFWAPPFLCVPQWCEKKHSSFYGILTSHPKHQRAWAAWVCKLVSSHRLEFTLWVSWYSTVTKICRSENQSRTGISFNQLFVNVYISFRNYAFEKAVCR